MSDNNILTFSQDTWIVTFHYNRGQAQIYYFGTSKEERAKMQSMVDIAVFNNQDCVNVNIVKISADQK